MTYSPTSRWISDLDTLYGVIWLAITCPHKRTEERLMVFSRAQSFTAVRCTKPLLGLYFDSCGSSYQKPKLKVKVWCLWPLLEAILLSKNTKTDAIWVCLLFGTQILNEGASCHYDGWNKALSTGCNNNNGNVKRRVHNARLCKGRS